MYKKCENCYKDGKVPDEESCKKCEDDFKAKEQECNKLYIQLKADEEYHKEEENNLRKIIKNKEERNIELYKENNKLKQTLVEIKEIAEQSMGKGQMISGGWLYQRICECEVE